MDSPSPLCSAIPETVATGKGNAGYLQVVVLGADGAYLLWLDNTGKWNIGIQTYQPENSTQQTLPNPEHLVFTAVAMGTGNNANKLQVILLAEDGLPDPIGRILTAFGTGSANSRWAG